jgi:hypothetical protein
MPIGNPFSADNPTGNDIAGMPNNEQSIVNMNYILLIESFRRKANNPPAKFAGTVIKSFIYSTSGSEFERACSNVRAVVGAVGVRSTSICWSCYFK